MIMAMIFLACNAELGQRDDSCLWKISSGIGVDARSS